MTPCKDHWLVVEDAKAQLDPSLSAYFDRWGHCPICGYYYVEDIDTDED